MYTLRSVVRPPQKAAFTTLLASFLAIAIGGVHHHLVRRKERGKIALVVETAAAREVNHLRREGLLKGDLTKQQVIENYKAATNNGILKVMSEMGISTLASYKGAQTFEILGLKNSVVDNGLFLIDPKGTLRQITINDLPVGRSVDETIRLIQAFHFTDEHGEVCPANWSPEGYNKTIKTDPVAKKEYFEAHNKNCPASPPLAEKRPKTSHAELDVPLVEVELVPMATLAARPRHRRHSSEQIPFSKELLGDGDDDEQQQRQASESDEVAVATPTSISPPPLANGLVVSASGASTPSSTTSSAFSATPLPPAAHSAAFPPPLSCPLPPIPSFHPTADCAPFSPPTSPYYLVTPPAPSTAYAYHPPSPPAFYDPSFRPPSPYTTYPAYHTTLPAMYGYTPPPSPPASVYHGAYFSAQPPPPYHPHPHAHSHHQWVGATTPPVPAPAPEYTRRASYATEGRPLRERLAEGGHIMSSGRVKFFDTGKGFGFIVDVHAAELDGQDVFVHYTGIEQSHGFRALAQDEEVEYALTIHSSGRLQALKVTGLHGKPLQGLANPATLAAVKRASVVARRQSQTAVVVVPPTPEMDEKREWRAVVRVEEIA
ncbi:hypothetical protein JCM10207_003221 [Rhodosporidiobolus poonsookiae]